MHIFLILPSHKSLFVHVVIIIHIHTVMTLTLYNDIDSAVPGSSMDFVCGFTGVYSCCTSLDVHDHEDPLITNHNSLRTEPRYIGIRGITIQVQCISFIEGGHPSDY